MHPTVLGLGLGLGLGSQLGLGLRVRVRYMCRGQQSYSALLVSKVMLGSARDQIARGLIR